MKSRLLLAALAGVCVLSVAAAGTVGAYAWHKREQAAAAQADANWTAVYRDAFRVRLAAAAGIKPNDSERQIAEKLTTHLYQATLFGGKPFATTGNNPLLYLQTVNHEVANMCANLSSTLVWALGLFDIPARSVNVAAEAFFTDPEGPQHTFVEVRADDATFAIDPTFDTTYSCDGQGNPLNAKAMFECVNSGRKLTWSYLGPPRPGRSVEEYPVPLAEHFFAMDAGDNPAEFYTYEKPRDGWLKAVREAHSRQATLTTPSR